MPRLFLVAAKRAARSMEDPAGSKRELLPMPNSIARAPSLNLRVNPTHSARGPFYNICWRTSNWKGFAVSTLLLFILFFSGFWSFLQSAVPRSIYTHWSSTSASWLREDLNRGKAVLIKVRNGAVATENEICSSIGVQTLQTGGNAVDAAVSSTLCIGVVNMFSSGIGGGGIALVRVPVTGEDEGTKSVVYGVDFRETAPAASTATMFAHNRSSSVFGGLAVGVPSEIKGLAEMHSRWGKLPWRALVQPSADLARGWKVQRELARRIQMHGPLMRRDCDWSEVFAPRGKLLREGDTIRRLALAKTLETVARNGSEAFYKGDIAVALIQKMQSTGGIMTMDDLNDYEVKIYPPMNSTYRGNTIYATGAPSAGPSLIHMLKIVEGVDGFHLGGPSSVNWHRIVETLKYGYAARTLTSDILTDLDVERINRIASQTFADACRANLTDDTTHEALYYNPAFDIPVDHGTSHTTVIDADRMVVSMTSTINKVFGSYVLDPVTGIILNNEMDDFSQPGYPNKNGLWPSPYNSPAPGKRPTSAMVPVIIEDGLGNFKLAVGGAGGARITGSVFQTILNVYWGSDISQAIEQPRVHDQLYPAHVDVEPGFSPRWIYGLKQRGHNVSQLDNQKITSVIQGVMLQDDVIFAASDSRKHGIAAGY